MNEDKPYRINSRPCTAMELIHEAQAKGYQFELIGFTSEAAHFLRGLGYAVDGNPVACTPAAGGEKKD